MPPYTTAGKNRMLDNDGITHIALFDGDPEGGGTECVGGGYSRQAITRGSASSAVKSMTGSLSFDVPAGFTVRYLGGYTASTSGTLISKDAVPAFTFGTAGTYIVNSASFTATDA